MTLGRLWAGRVYGTQTGNVFLKIDGENDALSGAIHLNDLEAGTTRVFALRAIYDGQELQAIGEASNQRDESVRLMLTLSPNAKGELRGEWNATDGGAGTILLFPHDTANSTSDQTSPQPDQLHTARHLFAAIKIDRNDIIALGEEMQREFKNARVAVTVLAGTEQSRFLPDFMNMTFPAERAEVVKLFIQEKEGNGGLNRTAQVEFGPQVNIAMTQGGDEAWVLGMLQKLKRSVRPFEQTYATNFKRWNFGFNQLLVVAAVVYLPSLNGVTDRAILMGGVLGLALGVVWLHGRYLPQAAIYLGIKPQGLLAKTLPSLASWMIAVTAGAAATLLAAVLQGWLPVVH